MPNLEEIDKKGNQGLIIASIAWMVMMVSFFLIGKKYAVFTKVIIFIGIISMFYGSITFGLSLLKIHKEKEKLGKEEASRNTIDIRKL